ncbi:hypothetical protein E2C01_022383 [Portunus trituberculatus]|uniref:Paired domain-containing protein n=1 Tax=Portunus trituberculatus TaxID=210409 RepID=A0A5B7E7J8_PORTR|nr:hypothetical protein [Portunus trituberculatus]
MSGKPLDHDTRVSVIQCHKLGLQTKDIVKETGVSEQSVRRLVAKFKASPSGQAPTPGKSNGRPTKINEISLRVLKRCVDVTPTLTARKLKEENPQLLGDVTVQLGCLVHNDILDHLLVVQVVVRQVTSAGYLPHYHTKAPHIGCLGNLATKDI